MRQHEPRFQALADEISAATRDIDEPTVLDVGADPYPLTEFLDTGNDLMAISYGDSQEEYHVRRHGRDITVRECNVDEDEWPFEDDEVDVVVMGAILEHLFDPLHALEEARRVGQQLVLSTPNATRLIQRARMVFGHNPFDGFASNNYHRHNHEWTIGELTDVLDVAGFETVESRRLSLQRPGIGRPMQLLTSVYPGWRDQLVVRCARSEPAQRTPLTYRESVVERESADDDK